MLTYKQLSIHSGTSTKPPTSTIKENNFLKINQQEMRPRAQKKKSFKKILPQQKY